MDVEQIEKSLILGRWDAEKEFSPIASAAKSVVQGDFKHVLTGSTAKKLFQSSLSPTTTSPFNFDPNLSLSPNPVESELHKLILGIACLHAFLQANWTGPDLDFDPLDVLQTTDTNTPNTVSIAQLARGGEPAYHLIQHPVLLRIAQVLLLDTTWSHLRTPTWWQLRLNSVHQQILDEPALFPDDLVNKLSSESYWSQYEPDSDLLGRLYLELGLINHHFSLDKVAAEYFIKAARSTGLQYELTGALGKRTKFQQVELSQLVLLAESRLKLNEEGEVKRVEDPASKTDVIPETLALNDDTLLEKTVFTSSSLQPRSDAANEPLTTRINPSSQPPLHPLDQSILLSLCLNVRNTSPLHGLTTEQMSPYVSRVLENPGNWSVHTMALLLRSRLEAERTRTVERSVLQLQALVDQMATKPASETDPDPNSAPISQRLEYIHSLPLPSKWSLQRELGERFLSLGVVRSALEIFDRLEMWEQVVRCYTSLEHGEKAVRIVKDLLEGTKVESEEIVARGKGRLDKAREAKLWCILGDLEPSLAQEHYQHAWEISNHTSGRAIRSLGWLYFSGSTIPSDDKATQSSTKHPNYEKAIECLEQATRINPLLGRSWFILGCAAVRVEKWSIAAHAFSRCVAIDDEDGESWSNLASVYLSMADQVLENEDVQKDGDEESKAKSIPFQNKLLAYHTLRRGLKAPNAYSNWKMWNNYMVVAMEVGELAEAARACGRVVEETAKVGGQGEGKGPLIDEEVVERLVDAVTRGVGSEEASDGIRPQVNVLLQSVTNLFTRSLLPNISPSNPRPRLYRAHGRLLTYEEKWTEAIESYMEGYRQSIAGRIQHQDNGDVGVEEFREACRDVEDIVGVLRNFGPKVEGMKWNFQARSILRTFLGRTKENFGDEPEWEGLKGLVEEIKNEGE